MVRFLASLVFAVAFTGAAQAQLVGTPVTGSGLAFTGQQYFVAPSADLAPAGGISMTLDMQIGVGSVTFPAFGGAGAVSLIDGGGTFAFTWNQQTETSKAINWGVYPFSEGQSTECVKHVCIKAGWFETTTVSSNSSGYPAGPGWHRACLTYDNTNGHGIMVDGVGRDRNFTVGTYPPTPSTPLSNVLTIGTPLNYGVQARELRLYGHGLSENDCLLDYYYFRAGISPTAGPLSYDVRAYWRLSDCVAGVCPDSSGRNHPASTDATPPTISISTPANAATLAGNIVPIEVTVADPIGIKSVQYQVNGSGVATVTAAPFTYIWDSTTVADGPYTITAIATNDGGVTQPTSISVTVSNGIGTKTVFADPTASGDCPSPNTGLSSGSPCTTLPGIQALINANPLHGGDNILFKAGTNMNSADMVKAHLLYLNGPSSTLGTQNTFPGTAIITIGTYSGSGNCHVLAGVTTDCASITMSANGTVLAFQAFLNIVNVANAVVQNVRFFGDQVNAQATPNNGGCNSGATGCAVAVRVVASNRQLIGGSSNASAVQNIETQGFNTGVYINSVTDPTFSSFGNLCHVVAQNDYTHGAFAGDNVSVGLQLNGGCQNNSIVSVSAISNVNQYIGGNSTGQDGSGVFFSNNTTNIVDNFNVSLNGGQNPPGCGPYGNWWYAIQTGAVKGNEVYQWFPGAGNIAGCDHGAFDLDNGTNGFVVEFNFGHETGGPSMNVLTNGAGSPEIFSGNNIVAYNLFENGNAGVSNQNSGIVSGGAEVGFFHTFNNSVWGGYNGTVVAPFTAQTNTGVLTYSCPAVLSYIANNIMVSNSLHFGANSQFVYVPTGTCSKIKYLTNAYFGFGTGALLWRGAYPFGSNPSYTTLAAWNAAVGANDILVNPGFAGSPPINAPCYALGSGIPGAPYANCSSVNAYEITNGAATENTGTDLSLPTYSLYTTILDFWNNAVPYTGHTGSSTNIGADGAFR